MSVMVAVPYSRPFYGSFIDSLLFMKKPAGMHWLRLPNTAIDLARETLAEQFLAHPDKPEHLLFVDNDATWHPLALNRLLSHNLPMVCGVMYTRDIPPSPTLGKYIGNTKDGKAIYRYAETVKRIISLAREHDLDGKTCTENAIVLNKYSPSHYLWEVDGCGMHYTLIRRDALEAVKRPRFIMSGRTGAGEDFYFCRKLKEAGYPIYVDLSIHTGHSVGEERDFGLRELLKMTDHLENLDDVICDDYGHWEIDKP